MLRNVRDPYVPDHDAFVGAEPPTGRVIVIAPTRAACETIELALGLHIETFLERTNGVRVRELAPRAAGSGSWRGQGPARRWRSGRGDPEDDSPEGRRGEPGARATPETPTWNVIVVTTGIAWRWFEEGDILTTDTIVVDEIHQTSAELELCLAQGKRVGCRFVWLSATVNPAFYARYLGSADVLEVFDFDPSRAADVRVVRRRPIQSGPGPHWFLLRADRTDAAPRCAAGGSARRQQASLELTLSVVMSDAGFPVGRMPVRFTGRAPAR